MDEQHLGGNADYDEVVNQRILGLEDQISELKKQLQATIEQLHRVLPDKIQLAKELAEERQQLETLRGAFSAVSEILGKFI